MRRETSECLLDAETDLDTQRCIEETDLQFRGQGVARVAFEDDGQIVKFRKSDDVWDGWADGSTQHEIELEVWERADEIRDLLVPVSDHSDTWIEMPPVDDRGGDPAELARDLVDRGWWCSDLKPQNVGRRGDQTVMLDYGSGCHPIDGEWTD